MPSSLDPIHSVEQFHGGEVIHNLLGELVSDEYFRQCFAATVDVGPFVVGVECYLGAVGKGDDKSVGCLDGFAYFAFIEIVVDKAGHGVGHIVPGRVAATADEHQQGKECDEYLSDSGHG